ncbi:hypothetical protein Golomagni_05580 [Golovinomyces magnicellulatus]|nr:hypothetical protein Golomagni_05580 [Golovinomyces magnicellulatus]
MRLRSYILVIIFISVNIFARIKAYNSQNKPASNNVECEIARPENLFIKKKRITKIVVLSFTKKELDKSANAVCLALNRIQACSRYKICRLTKLWRILYAMPEIYRGNEFSSTDGSKFFLTRLYKKGRIGCEYTIFLIPFFLESSLEKFIPYLPRSCQVEP